MCLTLCWTNFQIICQGLCLTMYLSEYLTICLAMCLAVFQSDTVRHMVGHMVRQWLTIYLNACLIRCQIIYLTMCVTICMIMYPSICLLNLKLFVSQCVCLSFLIWVWQYFWQCAWLFVWIFVQSYVCLNYWSDNIFVYTFNDILDCMSYIVSECVRLNVWIFFSLCVRIYV